LPHLGKALVRMLIYCFEILSMIRFNGFLIGGNRVGFILADFKVIL
jgi:hypothetical protein